MSTNIYINSRSFNFVKVGLVTQNCSVCQGNEPKSNHTISPNESSSDLMSKKGRFGDSKEFSNQKLQNVYQMEEELPELKKSPFKVVSWYFDQRLRSKDVCIYCDSTNLNPMDERIVCFTCSSIQTLPIAIFRSSILTLSGKVIILNNDGPYQVPAGTCRFCSSAALERISNELVCLMCRQLQRFQNLIPGNQVIFNLSSGHLLKLKGDDSDHSSSEGILIIEDNVDNNKYLLCEDCGSLLENGTPVPTF